MDEVPRSVASCPCAMGQFATLGAGFGLGLGLDVLTGLFGGFLQRPTGCRTTGASKSRPGAGECVESLGLQISWVNDTDRGELKRTESSRRHLGLKHVSREEGEMV